MIQPVAGSKRVFSDLENNEMIIQPKKLQKLETSQVRVIIQFRSYNSLSDYPKEVLQLIFNNLEIKELGRTASVCKIFNTVQNKPIFWKKIANLFHYTLTCDNDIKSQIRDMKINLELGEIDLLNKSITLNNNFKAFTTGSNSFLEKALAYFPKDYFISFTIIDICGRFPTFCYYENNIPKTNQPCNSKLIQLNEFLKDKKKIRMEANRNGAIFKDNHLFLVQGQPITIPFKSS